MHMEQKNYNTKNCIYMGKSQQFRSTPKLYPVTSAVSLYPNTGIIDYRTVPKSQIGTTSYQKFEIRQNWPKKLFFFKFQLQQLPVCYTRVRIIHSEVR